MRATSNFAKFKYAPRHPFFCLPPITLPYDSTVKYQQAPLPNKCIPLPNPNIPHTDPVALYAPCFQAAMTDSVKIAIRSASHISPKLNKDPKTGGYFIMEAKQLRAAYDDFLRFFTLQYGIDHRFKPGPKILDRSLLAELRPEEEYIFALAARPTPHLYNQIEMHLLPRQEILFMDNALYEGRHTHREFLDGQNDQSVIAAGTLFVSPGTLSKTVGYNLRTGHFGCHKDTKEKRDQLMELVFQTISQSLCVPGQRLFVQHSGSTYFATGSGPLDIPVENWEVRL